MLSDHPSLADRTRADLASAIRCLCKVMGLDPQVTDAGNLAALQMSRVRERHKQERAQKWFGSGSSDSWSLDQGP